MRVYVMLIYQPADVGSHRSSNAKRGRLVSRLSTAGNIYIYIYINEPVDAKERI